MRLYITIILLAISSIIGSYSLSAQDNRGDNRIDFNPKISDVEFKKIVRDYIRASRSNQNLDFNQRAKYRAKSYFKDEGENKFLQKLSVSVNIGTTDFGLQVATPLTDYLALRAGIGFMPSLIKVNKNIDVHDDALYNRVGEYYPDYDVDFKPKFFQGKVLLDFYPMFNVGFHVTAGFYLGKNEIKARGQLKDPSTGLNSQLIEDWYEWPLLNVEGYILDIEDGRLDADIEIGKIIKPYVGVGYEYTIPYSRWSFNADLGAMFQGSYKIRQHGKVAAKTTDEYWSSAVNIKKYTKRVKIWPVLNLQVSYRIY